MKNIISIKKNDFSLGLYQVMIEIFFFFFKLTNPIFFFKKYCFNQSIQDRIISPKCYTDIFLSVIHEIRSDIGNKGVFISTHLLTDNSSKT